MFLDSLPGINVLLFDIVILGAGAMIYLSSLLSPPRILSSLALLLTSIAMTVNAAGWTFFVHLILFGVFVGVLIAPEARSIVTSVRLGIYNLLFSWFRFFPDLFRLEVLRIKPIRRFSKHYYLVVPLVVFIVFVFMYKSSNPVFDGFVSDFSFGLSQFLDELFKDFNWQWFWTFILGLVISVFALVHNASKSILAEDASALDYLKRIRVKHFDSFKPLALINEWRAAIVLLVMLNLLIAVVNTIDVYWVWFNFEWEGEYLKQFVHEGTYILILSIFISVGIVLYFFRRNLNFYSKNVWLKRLCYLWLGQNAILALSVAIRNLHYINHFALATKRIGVMFFLLLVIIGIATVYLKVRDRRSAFFLFKWNALSLIAVLFLSAIPNWNTIITSYNFSHHETSFLHFDYLATFDAESIPYLDYSIEELQEMERIQAERFPFEEKYMTADEYYKSIQEKKARFQESMETATWQEWTFARQRTADYLAEN
ncbi:MAG TPA: hypothetical protein DCX14_05435 [Flavobacteriales bacterium]|nr:hypothetical protein [Flavobacteriales bacterium]